jgi:hypothetical protein
MHISTGSQAAPNIATCDQAVTLSRWHIGNDASKRVAATHPLEDWPKEKSKSEVHAMRCQNACIAS